MPSLFFFQQSNFKKGYFAYLAAYSASVLPYLAEPDSANKNVFGLSNNYRSERTEAERKRYRNEESNLLNVLIAIQLQSCIAAGGTWSGKSSWGIAAVPFLLIILFFAFWILKRR